MPRDSLDAVNQSKAALRKLSQPCGKARIAGSHIRGDSTIKRPKSDEGRGPKAGITVAVRPSGGLSEMGNKRDSQLTRRSFCNRALVTSAGLLLAVGEVKTQKQNQGQTLLMYPPVKIEGAERVLPGSFLYFNYPKSSDAAVLVRTTDGQFLAFSRKCA